MKKKSELLKKEKMMKKMSLSLFCALTLFMLMSRSFTKEISSCGGDNLILDAIQKKMEENTRGFSYKNDWSEKTQENQLLSVRSIFGTFFPRF